MEGWEQIDLLEEMYLPVTFQYPKYMLYEEHFLLFCTSLQLVEKQPVVLRIQIKSLWNIRMNLLPFVYNNKEWFYKDLFFAINTVSTCHDIACAILE